MFNCDNCNTQTKPGEKETKVVTEKRDMEYECQKRTEKGTITWKTQGWEIIKEKRVCPSCAILGGTADSENG